MPADDPPPAPADPASGAAPAADRAIPRPGLLRRVAIAPALALIRLYQLTLSPLLGPSCRFVPSCSRYAEEALWRFGLVRGGILAALRLLRCHPLGGSGYDPVPERFAVLRRRRRGAGGEGCPRCPEGADPASAQEDVRAQRSS